MAGSIVAQLILGPEFSSFLWSGPRRYALEQRPLKVTSGLYGIDEFYACLGEPPRVSVKKPDEDTGPGVPEYCSRVPLCLSKIEEVALSEASSQSLARPSWRQMRKTG